MIAPAHSLADPCLPRGHTPAAGLRSGLSPMVAPRSGAHDRSMNTPPGTGTGGASHFGYGAPPPPPRPPRRAPWRFVRREDGKWLAGVTTGMADAFGIDVTVVRGLWAMVPLFTSYRAFAARM